MNELKGWPFEPLYGVDPCGEWPGGGPGVPG